MAIASDSLSMPGKLTLRFCGSRCSSDPLTRRSGTRARRPLEQAVAQRRRAARLSVASSCRAQLARPSRSRRCRGRSACRSAARARGRRRASAAPSSTRLAPHPQRADALRPVDLVRGERHEVDAERPRRRTAPCPTACDASVWNDDAPRAAHGRRSRRSAAARRSRCSPSSRRRASCRSVSARSSSSRSTSPSASDAEHGSRGSPRARAPRSVSSTDGCSVTTVTTWRPRARTRLRDALDGEVVRLGRAAREDDVRVARADQRRPPAARADVDGLRRRPAERVVAARRRCRTAR